ncbi:MAG: DUF839 domain-containing protein [Myxococcales bacterium FL481]|nr:MAG: DUF839 domain-containing protein [Myxococcales bacterium FL481]
MEFPATDEQKRAILASERTRVDGEWYDIGYHTILRSGDRPGIADDDTADNGTFGLMRDQNGDPVLDSGDGSHFIANSADYNSILTVGDKLHMVTHFESLPGGAYLTEVAQDAKTGALTAVSTENIDFSAWGGLWNPCAGSVTPWGTHLGGEEYPPEARGWSAVTSIEELHEDYARPMLRYFNIDVSDPSAVEMEAVRAVYTPYDYGWAWEFALDSEGAQTLEKHYVMGRISFELAYVMPDQKTVYLTDDGTNVGLFMFVADEAGALDAGTLYAMKWNQTSDEGAGEAEIEWVDLGHATNADIRAYLDREEGIAFEDIFEVADGLTEGEGDDATLTGECPEGFQSTNAGDPLFECLKLKEGMETAASRFETRRYAAYLGATTELRKEEGLTFDPDASRMFVAMSAVERGMEDNKKNGEDNPQYDIGGPNDIRLNANTCGAVYGLDVDSDETIGSDFVAINWYGIVEGIEKTYADDSPEAGNSCDVDGIANPDNVTFITGYNTLIIGEDTAKHQNDVIWEYDLEREELVRIQTTPYGSETTSPYWYANIGGYGYITSVVQHPYGESDQDQVQDPTDELAYVGVVGPFPSMDE